MIGTLNFEKYNGKSFDELPETYLKWAYTTDLNMNNNHPQTTNSFQSSLEELQNWIKPEEFTLGFEKHKNETFKKMKNDKKYCEWFLKNVNVSKSLNLIAFKKFIS